MNKFAKASTATLITFALAVGLSGCFGGDEDNGGTVVPYNPNATETSAPVVTGSPKPTVTVVAPITLPISEIEDGLGLSLLVGESVDLTTENADPLDWKAVSSNPAVATAADGYKEGDALFNPGIAAVGPGEAEITVTSPDGSDVRTLYVSVVAPNTDTFDPNAGVPPVGE